MELILWENSPSQKSHFFFFISLHKVKVLCYKTKKVYAMTSSKYFILSGDNPSTLLGRIEFFRSKDLPCVFF